MALDISKISFGRDKQGIENAKNYAITEYKNLCNILSPNNSQYQAVIRAINENWSGSDAERYKKVIEADVANLKKAADTTYKQVINILDTAYNEFISFQAKN